MQTYILDDETEKCICCRKAPAALYTGYVIGPNDKPITAGWCRSCWKMKQTQRLRGFYGHWNEKMGLRKAQ